MNSVPLVSPIGERSRDFDRNWAVILTFMSLLMPFTAVMWLALRLV